MKTIKFNRTAKYDDYDHINVVISENRGVISHNVEFCTENAVTILYDIAKIMAESMGRNVTTNDLLEKAHKYSKRTEILRKLSDKMLKNCK